MDSENYESSDLESSDSEDDQYLKINIQNAPQGFIINSDMYLSSNQWNTIIYLDEKTVQCAVCYLFIDIDGINRHLEDEEHIINLDAHKPLNEFDLSIIRKIQSNYHCGVCNELFDENDIQDHIISTTHGENLNFAINKVSDIIYDSNMYPNDKKNDDVYHFNASAINNNNIKPLVNNYNNNVKKTYTSDSYFTDNNYNYFKSNDDQSAASSDDYYDDFEYTEVETPVAGVSYANMASKPKGAEIPEFVEKEFGSKKVTVKFDSWHMIIYPKKNQYYCMACKKKDHKRFRGDHCETDEHLMNLDKCKVVEMYEEHFIRQIDNKLLHCGHCNYLHLENEIIDHIEVVHPKLNKNLTVETKLNIQIPTKTKGDDNIHKVINEQELKPIKVDIKKLGRIIDNADTNKAEVKLKSEPKIEEDKPVPQSMPSSSLSTPCQQNENNMNLQNAQNDKNNNSNSLVTDLSKFTNFYENSSSKNIAPNKTASSTSTVHNSFKKAIEIKNVTPNTANLIDIFGYMTINPFGYNIMISTLSFNAICWETGFYYCGLCDLQMFYEEVLRLHVHELKHIQNLQTVPFIKGFDCHLIRAIRSIYHCGICNRPIPPQYIALHNSSDPQHLFNLNKALGILANYNLMQLPPSSSPNNSSKTLNSSPVKQTLLNNSISSNTSICKIDVIKSHEIPAKVNKLETKLNELTQETRVKETIEAATKTIESATKTIIGLAANATKISPTKTSVSKLDEPKPIAPKPIVSKSIVSNPIVIETKFEVEPFSKDFNTKEAKPIEQDWKVEKKRKTSDPPVTVTETETDDLSFEETIFDTEEHVYVKLNSSYFKITLSSYNSFVQIGSGARYCFVCSITVEEDEINRHVENREHIENVDKCRFLDKYEDQLLRQSFLTYHCGVCNVLITQSRLRAHLSWPTHILLKENSNRIVKKVRKNEIKAGTKLFDVFTQKCHIYLNVKESQAKITIHAEIIHLKEEKPKLDNYKKTNKIVIFKDSVLKISWESINGISACKNGFKCLLCQCDVVLEQEVVGHVESQWHKKNFDKPIVSAHEPYPALLRKINEAVLNCLICNTEVANNDYIITDHVRGKKHLKNYEMIKAESSAANTYSDCDGDVITVKY